LMKEQKSVLLSRRSWYRVKILVKDAHFF